MTSTNEFLVFMALAVGLGMARNLGSSIDKTTPSGTPSRLWLWMVLALVAPFAIGFSIMAFGAGLEFIYGLFGLAITIGFFIVGMFAAVFAIHIILKIVAAVITRNRLESFRRSLII